MTFQNNNATTLRSSAMQEKRKGQLAVPLNLRSLVTPEQLRALQSMTTFGWRLAFVRRNDPDNAQVVVRNLKDQNYAVLANDGSIDLSEQLGTRQGL